MEYTLQLMGSRFRESSLERGITVESDDVPRKGDVLKFEAEGIAKAVVYKIYRRIDEVEIPGKSWPDVRYTQKYTVRALIKKRKDSPRK